MLAWWVRIPHHAFGAKPHGTRPFLLALSRMLSGTSFSTQELSKILRIQSQNFEKGTSAPTIIGLQVTLALRGNRLVRLTIGGSIIAELKKLADSKSNKWSRNSFARYIINENAIEGIDLNDPHLHTWGIFSINSARSF